MGTETFTERDVMEDLRLAVADAGSQKAFAQQLGVSCAYVNDMLRGHRPVQGKVLAMLGYERKSVIVALPPDRAGAA